MEERRVSDARFAAYKVLHAAQTDGAYVNLAIAEVLGSMQMSPADKALASAIAYGCVKYRLYLDYVIAKFSSVKLKKLSAPVLVLLRIGVFQILKFDRVPDSAAVDECVRLAGKLAYRSKGFINGVLRSVVREKEKLTLPKDATERMSILYSFPKELTEHLIGLYGIKRTEALLAAFCEPPKMHVRVNTLKTSVAAVREALTQAGIAVTDGAYDDALVLSGTDITALEAYKNGEITAQGAGSMCAVRALNAKKGDTVLDLCAAPGGKSIYIAQRAQDDLNLKSFDIHTHKIDLILQTAARMGIKSITAAQADASVCKSEFEETADAVLVDAPCSGLGIIGKKPDIKYSWSKEKEDELAALQLKILDAAQSYVKPGGTLVYSTCTIGEKENLSVVRTFLEKHADFEAVDMTDALPCGVQKPTAKEGYVHFFPDTDEMDGFFVCKMKRK